MRSAKTVWLIVLVAAIILMITSGIRMSLGLFVAPITALGQVSIVQMSFALAVCQLMWGVSQPIAGALADRFGGLWVLVGGALLLAVGCALVPYMLSAWGLVLTLGVLLAFGAGAGSFSVLMGQVAQVTSDGQRGLASGVINAGSSFGQFLFAPLVQLFIALPLVGTTLEHQGWVLAFWVLAVAALLCVPLSLYLMSKTPTKAHKMTVGEQSLSQAIKSAMTNKNYLLIHLAFFTCGFHIAFLVTHLPMEVTLKGLHANVASWSLALIGLSNVLGSLFVGWCVGHYRCKYILFWMYFSRVLLIAVYLWLPKNAMTFYLFAIGLGFTWLATVPPTAGAIGKLFGVRYLATLFGLTLLSHQIGGFLGAYLGGLAIDGFGHYTYMWYADMVLAFLAAVSNLPIQESKVLKPVHN